MIYDRVIPVAALSVLSKAVHTRTTTEVLIVKTKIRKSMSTPQIMLKDLTYCIQSEPTGAQ